jgi:hypothetical protein
MSSSLASLGALVALLLASSAAAADETPPAAPGDAPAPAPAPASAPAPADAPASAPAPAFAPPSAPPLAPSSAESPNDVPQITPTGDKRRAEGVRLGLELGFVRAFDGAPDRLNAGSPTLLPIGADLSFRTSPANLLGFHGYAALASRDDCISVDSCRARAYGFGAHIESQLGRGPSIVPYIRYGVGFEMLYHGGAPLDPGGHEYRSAFDFLDLRIGADLIAARGEEGKTTRLGAYAGLVGGVLTGESRLSHQNGQASTEDLSSGSAHLWFAMGLRGTLDP